LATPSFTSQTVTYKEIYRDPIHVIKDSCIVAAGVGKVEGGTVMEDAGGANAGKLKVCTVGANALGVLEQPVDATSADQLGTLILHAYLDESECILPAEPEKAAAKAALKLIIWG
jgi:hypothetical protein